MSGFCWAILGTGAVSRKFALGLSALKGKAVVGPVASRNSENATAFCRTLDLGAPMASYEDAVRAPGVDAVYIATPPAQHEEHALLALAAGKPVLIEKPLSMDAAGAGRIAAAADAAGLFAMEAMWTRFQPLMIKISDQIQNGLIGTPRGFHGKFLSPNIVDPATSLFSQAGGGALLHRGVYPLSLARWFLGPVTDVVARARIGDSGVDEDITVLLTHKSGAISDIRASLRAGDSNACTLWGDRARIEIAGPVWRPTQARLFQTPPQLVTTPTPRRFEAFRESRAGQTIATLRGKLRGGARSTQTLSAPFLGNGYAHEADHLMQAVAAGQTLSDVMPLSQSVEVLEIVDTALRQIGRTP
ncbi:Gfo/Idh/MocA family oxidoreductase [Octadecabacter sp. 1_MG-2023]|uniref:Gfo/Idh/MocA family protein n=1 Tax=unclassified Octadecabacter TaxID=196158 RepID=UPI001C0830A1|nr:MULTISPECIES: Gfo/Idh/MocA family oxidoreductase [unclassified Octadecabacter]MBU2994065.1 Gfo/Idh/MocA family oxidoreductase [Octadecabacter sp. B2R22]MDO6736081.1 Gfo/Idh/MocA family oxidoreductase [Octadecabacter sp. 1_MG-2023]